MPPAMAETGLPTSWCCNWWILLLCQTRRPGNSLGLSTPSLMLAWLPPKNWAEVLGRLIFQDLLTFLLFGLALFFHLLRSWASVGALPRPSSSSGLGARRLWVAKAQTMFAITCEWLPWAEEKVNMIRFWPFFLENRCLEKRCLEKNDLWKNNF